MREESSGIIAGSTRRERSRIFAREWENMFLGVSFQNRFCLAECSSFYSFNQYGDDGPSIEDESLASEKFARFFDLEIIISVNSRNTD